MKRLAYWYLRLRGWTFHGEIPRIPKFVAIGAPHTSNWDFIVFLGALHHFGLRVSFLGKHTLFRWPLGAFFRSVGGIPVDRSKSGSIVQQAAAAFEQAESMILVIAPEGTRRPAPYWKPGFLRIAEAAAVPVVLAAVDFSRRRVTIGPKLDYRGDTGGFMSQVRSFYWDKQGKHKALKGPVTLRSEADDAL